jgi:hypothetical protein
VVKDGPLGQFLDFRLECAYVRLVLAHKRLEVLDMLFLGLVNVTRALRSFFACIARLFVANKMNVRKTTEGVNVR